MQQGRDMEDHSGNMEEAEEMAEELVDDAKALYDHLAHNRATACKEAFEQRGIAAARMLVTFASGHVSSGHAAKTDFVPRPMVELVRYSGAE